MTFFTLETPGNHHDFALMEIDAAGPNTGRRRHRPRSCGIQDRQLS